MKALLLVLALSSVVSAQEPTPFKWTSRAEIPQRISDVAVGVNVGLDAWDSLVRTNADRRWNFACRTGLTFGLAQLTKAFVHRERPNGADNHSFYSEHTAFAVESAGYNPKVGASLAMTVAWGRQAGGMHYGSDVAVGAGAGLFSRWICSHGRIGDAR